MTNTVNPLRRSILKFFGSGAALASTGVSGTALGGSILGAEALVTPALTAEYTSNPYHSTKHYTDVMHEQVLHSNMTTVSDVVKWLTSHENYEKIIHRYTGRLLSKWVHDDLRVPTWWFTCKLNDQHKIRRLALECCAQDMLQGKVSGYSDGEEVPVLVSYHKRLLRVDPPRWVFDWLNNLSNISNEYCRAFTHPYKHKARS